MDVVEVESIQRTFDQQARGQGELMSIGRKVSGKSVIEKAPSNGRHSLRWDPMKIFLAIQTTVWKRYVAKIYVKLQTRSPPPLFLGGTTMKGPLGTLEAVIDIRCPRRASAVPSLERTVQRNRKEETSFCSRVSIPLSAVADLELTSNWRRDHGLVWFR